ncbi:cysteine--tRNA ligase [Candidatus Wolfebacteria bacterium]|nr:MAG: cysteine--tRNA ligase [Candidatus Wolfebacteria bacterium]
MALELYNTLTRTKEKFMPLTPHHVGLYTCGPTVYNYPHIGNYRAYVFADLLKRHLEYSGYEVTHVMNLTDVDDKTIKVSQEEGKSLKEFTEFYSKEFFRDLESLHIEKADEYPRATDHINEMVELISTLLDKGYAYKSDDGSIYFSVEKYKDYGQLSHIDTTELKEGASGRIIADEYSKDSVNDFALWKAWDESDGDVFWDTKIGKGRPGWHIECSAMSTKYLGKNFDIHTGGVDLIFPHHENEIAQSTCCTNSSFVNYWLHNEWVLVDGKKMSKSLNNFYRLSDIEKKGISVVAYRYWLLMAQYRTAINFTWEALEAAESALKHLMSLYIQLKDEKGVIQETYKKEFIQYMDNDLDTPRALTVLWEVIKDSTLSDGDKRATIIDFDRVFGLGFKDLKLEPLPDNIIQLVDQRETARKEHNWDEADVLRTAIQKEGYEVKDTDHGPLITPIL